MNDHPIVLFDGVCNLCNKSVQFIIKHDKKKEFRFGSLQGKEGQKLLALYNLPADELNTLVLIENNKIYTRSTATLRIAKRLGGIWKLFYAYIIIPRFIRDGVYRIISRNRYKWFGKKDACMIPSKDLKERFLD
jgi:predicted DCC family thiol-disulfide oxidoreductase YuxK